MADLYPVKADVAAKARIDKNTYQQLYRESVDNPDAFWGKAAERLDWYKSRPRSATSATSSTISASSGSKMANSTPA